MEDPSHFEPLVQTLRPLRRILFLQLMIHYRRRQGTQAYRRRSAAANFLREYADRADEMVELLRHAGPQEFNGFLAKLGDGPEPALRASPRRPGRRAWRGMIRPTPRGRRRPGDHPAGRAGPRHRGRSVRPLPDDAVGRLRRSRRGLFAPAGLSADPCAARLCGNGATRRVAPTSSSRRSGAATGSPGRWPTAWCPPLPTGTGPGVVRATSPSTSPATRTGARGDSCSCTAGVDLWGKIEHDIPESEHQERVARLIADRWYPVTIQSDGPAGPMAGRKAPTTSLRENPVAGSGVGPMGRVECLRQQSNRHAYI